MSPARGSQALGGTALVFVGGIVAYLVLTAVEAWLQERKGRDAARDEGGHVALLVAIAIGLHNLGEGLAIGSAYAVGALALGAFLVIGFALHNTTEGLAIVAPVASRPPSLQRLALLGVIAGAPAILGAWIGASAFNSSLAALLLGAGAGAIVQVIQQLVPSIRARVGGTPARALSGERGRHPRRLRDPVRDQPADQRLSPMAAARTENPRPSEAIENYAKAIYALEQRGNGAVTNNALAERLHVTPASASSMVKKLDELGLVRHVPYKGVKLTAERPAGGARGAAPSPAAGAVPGGVAGRSVGPRARRGRGARARALRGARGADRGKARQPDARSARRPDPEREARDRRGRDRVPGRARARRARSVRARVGLRPEHAALPRRARHHSGRRASRSWTVSRSAVRCSPASTGRCRCWAASWRPRCASRSTRDRLVT